MVSSVKNAGVFDSDKVIRSFDNTEDLSGPPFILTNPAGILIGQIETGRTKSDLFFHIQNRSGQLLSLRGAAPQNMEGQSGRSLFPNSREPRQGFYEVIDGLGVGRHR
jgi:hypothetical protein